VPLLERLEPSQSFIDRDLSHRSTFIAALWYPTTTMASSSKRCQAGDLMSRPTFVALISTAAIGASPPAIIRVLFCALPPGYAALLP
jgi:hypothetical protein